MVNVRDLGWDTLGPALPLVASQENAWLSGLTSSIDEGSRQRTGSSHPQGVHLGQ